MFLTTEILPCDMTSLMTEKWPFIKLFLCFTPEFYWELCPCWILVPLVDTNTSNLVSFISAFVIFSEHSATKSLSVLHKDERICKLNMEAISNEFLHI